MLHLLKEELVAMGVVIPSDPKHDSGVENVLFCTH
jgi:hypothetical protein